MKALVLLCFAAGLALASQSGTIVQITHRLPLSANDKAPNRDFYVDLGTKHGLKEGDTVTISRIIPVIQSVSGQPAQLIRLALGDGTVVRTADFVSLVRKKNSIDPSQLPAMNYLNFMLGDQVAQLQSTN